MGKKIYLRKRSIVPNSVQLDKWRKSVELFEKQPAMAKINVQNTEITVVSVDDQDYISLTDMTNAKDGESRAADIIKNWIRNRYTIEYLGTWEQIHNPNFKVVEFDHFKSQAGLPSFVMSEELDVDAGIRYNSSLDAMHFGLCKKLVQYLTNNP